MKRLTALTLLLMWMHVVVLAQLTQAAAPAKCRCCSCKTGECCVGKSNSPESQPQPVAQVQSAPINLHLFILAASPAWLIPHGQTAVWPAASVSSLTAPRLPLFQRDCALLI